MNTALGAFGNRELELFQDAIAARLGLRFDDNRLTFLAEVLTRRVAARQLPAIEYLSALARDSEDQAELSELGRELTVGETYFFRHNDQFNALSEVALPERLSARAASRSLRLLSAGCASGEEAYSMAILVRERGIEPGFKVAIQGLDLNPDSLQKAAQGLYSPWALRETPPDLRQRWFQSEGKNFRISPALREAVRFEQHNLIRPAGALLPSGSFDVVFCRNVLMYFTPEHMAAIIEQLTRALAPGGFLFLGHAETLRGLSHSFHLCHTHNTFYYQRKERLEASDAEPWERPTQAAGRESGRTPSPTPSDWMGTWLETIERSSDRIRQLSDAQPAAQGARPAASSSERDTHHLSQPLELLRSERFGEALDLLGAAADPAALLLKAALLTQQGSFDRAEATCHELLRLDDLSAGAHYLLALCLERREQTAAAVEHDQTAVYLDGAFAMPHLHLGLMARRRGDPEAAKHSLNHALVLLEREDAARLLMFGGGFGRSALLGLCRSELASLGASP